MTRHLVTLDAAWAPDIRKFRTPQDWVVAALRAVDAPRAPENVVAVLRSLRHSLWSPIAPEGYPDGRRAWADSGSLMNRAELARSFARRFSSQGVRPKMLLETVDVAPDDSLRTLMSDETIGPRERVALALGGPAFQWR